MNALNRGWRYAAVLALVLGLPVAAACSAGDGTSTDVDNTESELEIEFPEMYSAFIPGGDHEFKIPARVDGVKNVKWSADPADSVSLEKQKDGSVMITTLKAGKVTIIAKAGSLKASAPLTIASATEEDWTDGKARYANGVVFKKPQRPDGGAPGGGFGKGDGGGKGERKVDPSLACTNCHNKGGKDGNDVEHTPMQTGGYSDEELVAIFTKAEKPEGIEMRTTTKEKWQRFHKWSMDADEQKGLITYLRSLEPKSQGEVDFSFPGRGKGKGKGDGTGGGSKDENKPSEKPEGDGGKVN